MINPKTLRIGNYFQSQTMLLEIVSIDGFELFATCYVGGRKNGDIQFTDAQDLFPIEINNHLILGLGFVKEEIHLTQDVESIWQDSKGVIIWELKNGAYKFSDDVKGVYEMDSDIEFKYIHQLQNRYFNKYQRLPKFDKTPDFYEIYL